MARKDYSRFPKLQDGILKIRCDLMSYQGQKDDFEKYILNYLPLSVLKKTKNKKQTPKDIFF